MKKSLPIVGLSAADLKVVIGPSIGPDAFEVGEVLVALIVCFGLQRFEGAGIDATVEGEGSEADVLEREVEEVRIIGSAAE